MIWQRLNDIATIISALAAIFFIAIFLITGLDYHSIKEDVKKFIDKIF